MYNDSVIRIFRFLMVLTLAAALPLQAGIIAYAQVVDTATHHQDPASAPHDRAASGHSHASGEPCDDSELGDLKCCHSHIAWAGSSTGTIAVLPPAFERNVFVAGWTSFIPEEPSPPPIRSAA